MKQLKTLTLTSFAVVAALSCSDTLRAQVLTVTPSALSFTGIPPNATSQAQTLSISWNQSTTGTAVITPSQSWILLGSETTSGPFSVNFTNAPPTALAVRVNTQGLAQGSYSGNLTVTVSGQTTLQQTVNVTLTVGAASVLSANPATLSFSALQGSNSATPSSSTVQISSSGAVLNYSIAAQTQPSGSWLLLGATSGTSGDTGFQVFTNPSGLAAGTYTGTVTVQSTSSADSVQIPVTLTVNANATLTVSPTNPAPILWQTGTADPSPLQLNVTSSSGNATFTAGLSPSVSWLQLSTFGGSTPGSISLFPKPSEAGLTAGTYTTSVVIASGTSQVTVPITLIAAAHPLIQLSSNSLSYSGTFGSTTPPPDQTVQVTAADGSKQGFNFASDSAWLTASTTGTNFASSGSGSTPSTLTVHVNPNLPVGTSTGTIKVTPSNGDNYTQTITVTMSVTAASALQAGPQALLFSYQMGQTVPGSQLVSVVSTGQPIQFTVTPSVTISANCPANWLAASASSSTTPATVTVTTPGISSMAAGVCSGAVALNYTSTTGPTQVIINISAAVSAANQPELAVSMPAGFGLETAAVGAQSYTRTISLTSTSLNSAPDFQALVTSSTGGAWLAVTPNRGNAPANLTVTVSPSVLTNPGTYNGSIQISSSTIPNYQLTIPVALTLTSNVSAAVSPTSLTFAQAQGGPLPPSQSLTLTSTNGTVSFTSSVTYAQGSNWLQVPASGATSGTPPSATIPISIASNTLSPGQYNAQIVLALSGAAQQTLTIPVTLNVGPAQTLTASPSSLNFAYQINGTAPASQKITLTSTGGPVAFTVGTTSSSGSWLSTDVPSSGSTTGSSGSKDINVSVNVQGLTAGTYNGSVSISAPGVLASPIVVPVVLTVTAQAVPQPLTVQNGASYVATAIAPGEIITIKGSVLGPATPATFTVNASGGVDSTLAGVQVLFGGVPGTPIYVSAGQINVIVPWEIGGQLTTSVVVSYNNVQSTPIVLAVRPESPGLYTMNMQGTGQLASVNQNGTLNGVTSTGPNYSPAPQGSVVEIYATGGGQTNPAGKTGSVTPISPLMNISGVTATVGGVPATVQFAGAAPGYVTGLVQINVLIPNGVAGDAVPVTVSINGISTTQVTTIAVQ